MCSQDRKQTRLEPGVGLGGGGSEYEGATSIETLSISKGMPHLLIFIVCKCVCGSGSAGSVMKCTLF